jgi:hypothetical protein
MTTHISTRIWVGTTLVACAAMASLSASVDRTGSTIVAEDVTVTVKYAGKGDVDPTHRVWIWLFDTPDIGPGAIPFAEQSLEKNGATATFSGVAAQKVWIAVAYDEKGGFAGSAPPPSGSPVMIYGMETGAATPVTPGAQGGVTMTFDDSQRMP